MRVLFAGGGTGGHINPALSIANYIKQKDDTFEALFIGTKSGLEKKLVPAAGYELKFIDIKGFNRRKLHKNVEVIYKLMKARNDCKTIIQDFKPDVVVCTGGYVSGPVAMAAKKLKVPVVIHEQNVYPGLTVKGAQKYVDYVFVSFDETVNHLKYKDKCIVTGNPIRSEILDSDYKTARKTLGLGDEPFVFVFGGSLGAGKINDTMIDVLKRITEDNKISLMFGTGDRNFDNVIAQIKENDIKLNDNIKILPYINNMHDVMAAADLVVARAGAITVSEIAALGKPSILIPSPNVVRNHQEQNAREFEAKDAAAVIVETDLTPNVLYDNIMELSQDKDKLKCMSDNVRALAKTDALDIIYDIILKLKNK